MGGGRRFRGVFSLNEVAGSGALRFFEADGGDGPETAFDPLSGDSAPENVVLVTFGARVDVKVVGDFGFGDCRHFVPPFVPQFIRMFPEGKGSG